MLREVGQTREVLSKHFPHVQVVNENERGEGGGERGRERKERESIPDRRRGLLERKERASRKGERRGGDNNERGVDMINV